MDDCVLLVHLQYNFGWDVLFHSKTTVFMVSFGEITFAIIQLHHLLHDTDWHVFNSGDVFFFNWSLWQCEHVFSNARFSQVTAGENLRDSVSKKTKRQVHKRRTRLHEFNGGVTTEDYIININGT